ncbi:MAG: hypothetical protein GX452_04900 [Ignavibacteriales bacterium]|nr:hypothetical protein [Ignavibacteriales bacterium]
MSDLISNILPSHEIETNISQGLYRPRFFEAECFNLSGVIYNTVDYIKDDPEGTLLKENYSFAYLREDKLRTIDAVDRYGNQIPFNSFLKYFSIDIRSRNLFKTGKYLSRILRPTKYAKFYSCMKVYVNNNPRHQGKKTDGISLISLKLAESLGWKNVIPDMSAQFTLFYKDGLVKGNCVVSDRIESDIVIYGKDNIKDEIRLTNNTYYVAIEPLKLSKRLRMDIQSLLNLWNLFGPEQFLEWTNQGIEAYKKDLFDGKLIDWLDDFDTLDPDDYNHEKWTLRKALWHKIDYRSFPGLLRLAWSMFRNSMIRYAVDIKGQPVFRIPVPGGYRGYFRVDLRDHDEKGNFVSLTPLGTVTLDRLGNIWIHEDDIEEFLSVKGGADLDDNAAIIPVEDGKAVIFRNPNQYGEYGIHRIVGEGVEFKVKHLLQGTVPMKKVSECCDNTEIKPVLTGNSLLDKFLKTSTVAIQPEIRYISANLIRVYSQIKSNSASIGLAANVEMIRSCVGIYDNEKMNKMIRKFNWNLEKIIDSTVKTGSGAEKEMMLVAEMLKYSITKRIKIAESLLPRVPESMRAEFSVYKNHPLDLLLRAIEYLVDKADIDIIGRGSVSRGDRQPGRIDHIEIPFIEIGKDIYSNPIRDLAINLMKDYNRSMAILLDSSKKLDQGIREITIKNGIEVIQNKLLERLSFYTDEERMLITQAWAYEIYKSVKFVHDSILWISDKESFRGTAGDTIKMLGRTGIGENTKKENDELRRFKGKIINSTPVNCVRLWRKEILEAETFKGEEILTVSEGKATLKGEILSVGDETRIKDGVYPIRAVEQSVSKKNSAQLLRNSITLYLAN